MIVSGHTPVRRRRAGKVIDFPEPVRKLLVPREHGSWGLWLLPLITGAVAGTLHAHRSFGWAIFWLCVAALSAFLAYQPLEALLGFSLYKVRSSVERKIVAGWVLLTSAVGCLAALALIQLGRVQVVWFAALGIACFGIRLLLGKARRFRVVRQILGALSLTSTAAAAYYATVGKLDRTAMLLWAANWLFAAGQIEYVQLRVRTVTVRTRLEKLATGLRIAAYHLVLLYFAIAAATVHEVHPFFAIAFVPAVARIFVWLARKPEKTDFHVLGFSELFQGALFNAFLLAAFLGR